MGLIFRPKAIARCICLLLLPVAVGTVVGQTVEPVAPAKESPLQGGATPGGATPFPGNSIFPQGVPAQPILGRSLFAPAIGGSEQSNAQGEPIPAASPAPVASVLPSWPLASLLPPKVRVYIHYKIMADRLGRVVLYRHFMAALAKAGFERDLEDDPDPSEPENQNHVLLTGTIPSASLIQFANLSAVRSVLLTPVGFDLNKAGERPVRVEMMLGRGSTRVLADISPSTHKTLDAMGFKESVIYGTYRGTRLLGSLPANQLLNVGTALGLPIGARAVNPPFQPVLAVWVEPLGQLPTPAAKAPEAPAGFSKVAPDLRKPLAEAGKLFRVELLFDRPFASQAAAMEGLAKMSPNLVFEALLGSAVTVVGSSEDLRALANDPQINAIRPGPVAHAGNYAAKDDAAWNPLRNSPLGSNGPVAINGKILRESVAIIDSDFRMAEALPGWKEGKVQLLDLTRERDTKLQADPYSGPVNEMGRGSLFAKKLLELQPAVRLVLIRIDPSVPAMIQRVARAIQGDNVLTDELMARRLNEIRNDRLLLTEEREILEKDWKDHGDDFGEEPEALRKRKEYRTKIAAMRDKEQVHHQRLQRYLTHQKTLQDLKAVRLVLCPLVWNEGLPRDGASALSRWFDDRPFRSALWVQSAGDRQGQTWAGMFRDRDKNGVMEWLPLERGQDPFPAEGLAILWKQTDGGKVVQELPAGTRIRTTVQWRELRDPSHSRADRNSGRTPIADLRIRLVRLEGVPGNGDARLAERVTVSQPVGPALLIDHNEQSAVFESSADLDITQAGRYEVRLEGQIPDSILPPAAPQLPINRIRSEIHPVIWLRSIGQGGMAVFPQTGDKPVVGVPGDAQQVLSVISVDGAGQFPLAWDPSNLIERSDRKPDLILQGAGKNGTDAVFGAAAAILPLIHPDQDVRFWKRTPALPGGLTRSLESRPTPE